MRRDAKILSGIDFSPSVFFFLFPSKSISRLFIFIRDRSFQGMKRDREIKKMVCGGISFLFRKRICRIKYTGGLKSQGFPLDPIVLKWILNIFTTSYTYMDTSHLPEGEISGEPFQNLESPRVFPLLELSMIPTKLLRVSKPVRMVEISRDSYGTLWKMNMNIGIRKDEKNQRRDNFQDKFSKITKFLSVRLSIELS